MIFSAKRNAEYHQKTFRSFNDTPHGPSGGSRTHGLMDPNHARYQLRYTRIQLDYYTEFFSVCQGYIPGKAHIEYKRIQAGRDAL